MANTKERIVYVNGDMVPESKATVSVFDRGFRWGDGVYEVTRTFRGKPFQLEQHIDRLYDSLFYTRIDPGMDKKAMTQTTKEVLKANIGFLKPNDDYTITQIISRGRVNPERNLESPTVVIYCQPIGFAVLARHFTQGIKVVTPATRRTPPQSLSPKAKISNKMNHFVAQFEARAVDPDAFPLMLDLDGNITESHAANFLFVSKGIIRVPNRRNVLNGISMQYVVDLASSLGIPTEEGNYTPFDVYQAEEAFFTGTSSGLLPVASLNGLPIGDGVPGPVATKLLSTWSELVGVDIVDQALSHV